MESRGINGPRDGRTLGVPIDLLLITRSRVCEAENKIIDELVKH